MGVIGAITFVDGGTPTPYVRPVSGSFLARGTWSSVTVYSTGDVVSHTSGVYNSLQSNTNVTPGTNSLVWQLWVPSGAGVTNVAMTVPSFLAVTGSPITGTGTLAVTLATQAANTMLLGPTSGAAATPAFRALVGADMPNLVINTQVGTTYAIAATDKAAVITFSNAASIAASIAQATGSFGAGWYCECQNLGAGIVTITPVTSTIDSGATITLKQGESISIVSAGGNYVCLRSKVRAAFSDITGTVTAAQLPNPTASTLGGVESLASAASKWINAISTSGVPTATQPAFTDISGTATGAQLPVPAAAAKGGVFSKAAVTHNFLTSISSADGSIGQAQPTSADLSGGLTLSKQIFTASGTFTIPSNVTACKITVVGGGGAGSGANTSNGGGGGAGGMSLKWLSGLTPGNTLTVVIGAGGTAVSNAGGNSGGNTTVASGTQTISTITGGGGIGGVQGAPVSTGGNGGSASGGDLNNPGNPGGWAYVTNTGAVGGASMFGGAGSIGFIGTAGSATAAGSGGGGSGAGGGAVLGGAGFAGIVIFEWVA